MMKPKISWWLLATFLLTTAPICEAQQPKKIPRIGYLEPGTASGNADLLDGFRQELSKLGWIEGKISPSSTGLPSKRMSGYPSLQRTWFVLTLI